MQRYRIPTFVALMALASASAAQVPAPAAEDADLGVPPSAELRFGDHASATPVTILGARFVTTPELKAALGRPPAERPILFDVLGGAGHDSLPGAIWLPDAGRGTGFDDELQQRLARTLAVLTNGDAARPMVFFCASVNCWLSYNAALRAARLGYTAVGWYRGGIQAWIAAGGALAPMKVSWRRPGAN